MIKYSELKTIFNELSFNCYEYNLETNEEISLPYCVYIRYDFSGNSADGVNYLSLITSRLVLVDGEDNSTIQEELERLLNKYEIYYSKEFEFDEDERIYTIIYEFEVLDG